MICAIITNDCYVIVVFLGIAAGDLKVKRYDIMSASNSAAASDLFMVLNALIRDKGLHMCTVCI